MTQSVRAKRRYLALRNLEDRAQRASVGVTVLAARAEGIDLAYEDDELRRRLTTGRNLFRDLATARTGVTAFDVAETDRSFEETQVLSRVAAELPADWRFDVTAARLDAAAATCGFPDREIRDQVQERLECVQSILRRRAERAVAETGP